MNRIKIRLYSYLCWHKQNPVTLKFTHEIKKHFELSARLCSKKP